LKHVEEYNKRIIK